MAVLSAKNVNLWYGGFQALRNISIEIKERQGITAFIGPSGCGKSTLLRLFNRMNDGIVGCRRSGAVEFDGHEVQSLDETALRRCVGMVFQRPVPFPMSIFDNVAYGPRLLGVKSKAVLQETVEDALRGAALFDEVKDKLRENAAGLSGGQQQRLCIARALAVNPRVLLLDEPTSALDPIATSRVEDLLEVLQGRVTVVLVTHNMAQARRIAKKTAFFLLGELVEAGDTTQIFENPHDERTRRYIDGKIG